MPPSPSAYDYWIKNPPSSAKIQVDCLMPNGVFIPVIVHSDSVLSEVKEDLWEEARKYPLQGLLKEQSLYNFLCINSMAENEELVNEGRRLCDVRPFCNVLKVVEREGDKNEEILNAQIGHLIGKGLHDFDSLKSLEVNDFRYQMKTMVAGMNLQKKNLSSLEKIKHHYPCHVADSNELPLFLSPKVCDGNIVVSIRIDNTDSTVSPFSIAHTARPVQLLTMALQKNAVMTGQYPFSLDMAHDYVLKLCGRQEYLIGDYYLSRFLCVRDLLVKDVLPSFVVVSIEKVLERTHHYQNIDLDPKPSLTSRNSSSAISVTTATLKRKAASYSSWNIDDSFSFRIDAVSRLNCVESEVGIQAGIFHGGRSLCEPKKTSAKHSIDGESTWNEILTFDIRVRDVPRTARLCIVVYGVSKMAKGKHRRLKNIENELYINPIAWVNTTIFDYKSQLKTGSFTLYMWTYAEDLQNDEIMNPLGTVVSNPNLDDATALTVAFTKYNPDKTVVYPMMDVIQEVAALVKNSITEDGALSRVSFSGNLAPKSSYAQVKF